MDAYGRGVARDQLLDLRIARVSFNRGKSKAGFGLVVQICTVTVRHLLCAILVVMGNGFSPIPASTFSN